MAQGRSHGITGWAFCRKLGLAQVLLTCMDANVGSWKVIESNGGVFERMTVDQGQLARRYWIEIS